MKKSSNEHVVGIDLGNAKQAIHVTLRSTCDHFLAVIAKSPRGLRLRGFRS